MECNYLRVLMDDLCGYLMVCDFFENSHFLLANSIGCPARSFPIARRYSTSPLLIFMPLPSTSDISKGPKTFDECVPIGSAARIRTVESIYLSSEPRLIGISGLPVCGIAFPACGSTNPPGG